MLAGCSRDRVPAREHSQTDMSSDFRTLRDLNEKADELIRNADLVLRITGDELDNTVLFVRAWTDMPERPRRKDIGSLDIFLDSAMGKVTSSVVMVPTPCFNLEHVTNVVRLLEQKTLAPVKVILETENGIPVPGPAM